MTEGPRPQHPSDEAWNAERRKTKPHVRVHHSATHHHKTVEVWNDNDLLAAWVRILMLASKQGAAHTQDILALDDREIEATSGKGRRDVARRLLERLANVLGWSLERRFNVTLIKVRNFAKKQGLTPRNKRTDQRTPLSSPPPVPTPHSPEKKIEPTALVPVGTNKNESAPVSEDEDGPVVITPEDLVEAWNETTKIFGLPAVREIRGSRRKKTILRLHEHPTEEFWRAVFSGLARSKFLTGQSPNKKGPHAEWRATFDWLIKDDVTATKISEGGYA